MFTRFIRGRRAALLAGLSLAVVLLATLSVRADDRSLAAASEARLLNDARVLASEDFEGRGPGTKGLDLAADLLAERFRELGLKTDLFDGGPFQKFKMSAEARLGGDDRNRLQLVGPPVDGQPQAISLELGQSFNPLAIGGSGAFEAPLVFVGYGITSQEPAYDDYAGLDVKGKVVIIVRKAPQQGDPHSPFGGDHPSTHAFFTTKVANAATHGAAAVILVNDGHGLEKDRTEVHQRWLAALDELAAAQQKFQALDKPTDEQSAAHQAEVAKLLERLAPLQQRLAAQGDTVLNFTEAGVSGSHPKLPVFFASRSAINQVMQAALGKSLTDVEAEIDADLRPRSGELAGWRATGESLVTREQIEVKNVVAVLEGEGPLANEYIVIGAHYDHLGYGGAGSLAPWTREIHPGADDNASGTAALLETAHRLANLGRRLPRTIVFIAFTAEERGLLGSEHYVRNPRFPLGDTVAMLNMDMVGRLKDNKLVVYGTGTAENFDSLVDQLNQQAGFQITKKPTGYGPSDHAAFYPKKIPVIHTFTDTHEDYHRPSDTYDKLNYEGMRRIAEFITDFAIAVAENPERPKYLETRRPQVARGGRWPYFGSVPDYASNAEGMALKDVAKDGPAAQAGLQGGDVIVQMGDLKIAGVEDFAAALGRFKAGEKVAVKALRDGQEVTVTVELGQPR